MGSCSFVHRLTLGIQLVHAATGENIPERDAMFYRDKKPLRLKYHQDGMWLGVDMERTDFRLGVTVRGFEEMELSVKYDAIGGTDPLIEVFLVPKITPWNREEFLTLEGTLAGIEQIEAVNLVKPDFYVSGYDRKEKILSLFYPHRKRITQEQYGILSKDGQSFEIFTIDEYLPGQMVRLRSRLKREAERNDPVAFPVRGIAGDGGRYCLRVPRTPDAARWLIRYTVKGKECFAEMDLQKPKPLKTPKRA